MRFYYLENRIGLAFIRWRIKSARSHCTMSSPHRVAIVVDRQFGDRLLPIAERLHVWICHSSVNRAAAEAVWKTHAGHLHDLNFGVTIFNCSQNESAEDMVLRNLGTIDEHHGEHSHDPPWSIIEVVGCQVTELIRNAFATFGAELFNVTTDRFEARRSPEIAL
jgi:hypothetical protein